MVTYKLPASAVVICQFFNAFLQPLNCRLVVLNDDCVYIRLYQCFSQSKNCVFIRLCWLDKRFVDAFNLYSCPLLSSSIISLSSLC